MKSIIPTLAALTFLHTAMALPANDNVARTEYPTVYPGPGLPSLESLGLTSADLYTKTPPAFNAEERSALEARYNNVCETYTTGNVDNVIACYNYLNGLGTQACRVNGDNVQFCRAGDAQITGSNISGTGSASSYCSDVARGLQWIFTYCNVGGRVGGSAAANGNGYLIVGVENINW